MFRNLILYLLNSNPSISRLPSSAPAFISDSVYSENLVRDVKISLLLSATTIHNPVFSVLVMFDGQDFPAVRARKALEQWARVHPEEPLMIVGVHANKDRIYEYGTAARPDYAYRGNKAANTTHFVVHELIPYLKENYSVSKQREAWSIGGFSLGGLMALDIAWHHSELFSGAGVFSGSFWWRQRALEDDYDESDRIMHQLIRETTGQPLLKFWFQTGTRDEEADRDNDGIIDSIDDTLDLIAELERKGYQWGNEIVYREILDGEHNQKTWSEVFPEFLRWSQEGIPLPVEL